MSKREHLFCDCEEYLAFINHETYEIEVDSEVKYTKGKPNLIICPYCEKEHKIYGVIRD